MRLIDADKLNTSLSETVDAAIKWHEDCLGEIMQNRSEAAITAFIECILRLKEQPTVDAVEVVRCKDCKHYALYVLLGQLQGWCERLCDNDKSLAIGTEDDDFCSHGERRGADG